MNEMKEQDALIVVAAELKRLIERGGWGKIEIEINHGKIKFVNTTQPAPACVAAEEEE